MSIKIRLFASLRNRVGKKELDMNIADQVKVKDVIKLLNLPEQDNFITMINGIHCKLDHSLKDGDVLSIFPMMAGG